MIVPTALLLLLLCAPSGPAPGTPLAGAVERLEEEVARLRAELAAARAAGDTGARLEAMERELARLAEELRQAAAAVDALSQAGERRTTVTVYGDFEARSGARKGLVFDGHSFELVLSGHPHERLSFFGEVEFEQAAGVGGARGGEIVVEQAWASLRLASPVHLKAGILLVPFGNVNVDHFAPRREVVTRPLVSHVVAPADWTDNGVGLAGSRLLGSQWLVSYEAFAVAGLGADVGGAGMRAARQPYGADNNGDKALVGRLALNRTRGLHLGLSGYRGRYDDAGERALLGWAVDGLVELGPLKLTGEWNAFRADREPAEDARLRGFYARVVVDLGRSVLRRTSLGRDFDDPRLAAVAQLDEARVDGPAAGGFERNRERRLTTGLALRPSGQWVLKLGWEWSSHEGEPLVSGTGNGFAGAIGFVF